MKAEGEENPSLAPFSPRDPFCLPVTLTAVAPRVRGGTEQRPGREAASVRNPVHRG